MCLVCRIGKSVYRGFFRAGFERRCVSFEFARRVCRSRVRHHEYGSRARKSRKPRPVFDDSECKGGNKSPQLSWRGAPEGTRSYAITLFDSDAPGRGWYHWAVAGITTGVSHINGNASASGESAGWARCRRTTTGTPTATAARARRRASHIAMSSPFMR